MIKCPNCNGIVRAVNTIDSEWELGRYYDTVKGTCPECGLSWQWDEVYTFDHVESIKPININDHT